MPSASCAGASCAGGVDVDTHHRSSHARQPIRGQEGRIMTATATELDRRRRGRACDAAAAAHVAPASRLRRVPASAAATGRSTTRTRCSSEIDRSGLLGRGGAAFPLAVKLRTVRDAGRAGADTVVLANGEEGEPASVKDRWLLRNRPHLVLDGVRLAARIVGARPCRTSTCRIPTRPTRSNAALADGRRVDRSTADGR